MSELCGFWTGSIWNTRSTCSPHRVSTTVDNSYWCKWCIPQYFSGRKIWTRSHDSHLCWYLCFICSLQTFANFPLFAGVSCHDTRHISRTHFPASLQSHSLRARVLQNAIQTTRSFPDEKDAQWEPGIKGMWSWIQPFCSATNTLEAPKASRSFSVSFRETYQLTN